MLGIGYFAECFCLEGLDSSQWKVFRSLLAFIAVFFVGLTPELRTCEAGRRGKIVLCLSVNTRVQTFFCTKDSQLICLQHSVIWKLFLRRNYTYGGPHFFFLLKSWLSCLDLSMLSRTKNVHPLPMGPLSISY